LQRRRIHRLVKRSRLVVVPAVGAERDLRAGEAAARRIEARRGDARLRGRVARQIGAAEVEAVERDVVLVGAEAEHGEAARRTVDARNERDAGQCRRHRRQVAEHVDRHVVGVERLLTTADLRSIAVAIGTLAPRNDAHGVERDRGLADRRVGDQHVLVHLALDLEPHRLKPDGRVRHHIVAAAPGKDDREAAILVRLGRARRLIDERRRGHGHVLDRLLVRTDHSAADDVGCVLCVQRCEVAEDGDEQEQKRATR
jgi:hypothetical protein